MNIVLLISFGALALIAVGLIFFSVMHFRLRKNLFSLIDIVSQLQQETRILRQADLTFGVRSDNIENEFLQLKKQVDVREKQDAIPSAYTQAMKMVEMGANMKDITQTCHLSSAEAKLLLNIKSFAAEHG